MEFSESIFATRFQITRQDLQHYLSDALSKGGDYADLYFEYLLTSSLSLDESMVKSATQGVSMGVGVRVISGERTGYAYSDDLAPDLSSPIAITSGLPSNWISVGNGNRLSECDGLGHRRRGSKHQ